MMTTRRWSETLTKTLTVVSARWLWGLTCALSLAPAAAAQVPPQETIVITGATVIDGTGREPLEAAEVVVIDGRIASVGAPGSQPLPEGARVIAAEDRWLLPGLIDSHAHLTLGPVELDVSSGVPAMSLVVDPEIPLRSMRTLLAYGVTSVRDPGGSPAGLVALRDAVATGALVGPRLRVAGLVIDRSQFTGLVRQVADGDDVRAAVRADAAAGVDMVKLYTTLTPDLLAAAIDEAHGAGLEAVGHLMMTTWTEAAELGLDHILHIVPGSPALLPEARRAEYLAMMQRGTQFMTGWFDLVDFESSTIRDMIAALVEHEVSVDPTLVVFEGMVRGDDPAITESEALELAAPSLVANWRAWFNFNTGWTPEDYAAARATWPRLLELTRRLHAAGVTLTAGTDANNPWTVPGVSFHRELELLVEAGIPPLEVLRIATRNGAEVLGLLDEVGTIEVGKWADLVLLDADPTREISNTRRIEWVMQAGRLHRPEDLLAGIH